MSRFRINTENVNRIQTFSVALSPFCVGDDMALTDAEVEMINSGLVNAKYALEAAVRCVQSGRDRFAGNETKPPEPEQNSKIYLIKETVADDGQRNLYIWTSTEFGLNLPWLFNVVDFKTFVEVDMTTEDTRVEVSLLHTGEHPRCIDCINAGVDLPATTFDGNDLICGDCADERRRLERSERPVAEELPKGVIAKVAFTGFDSVVYYGVFLGRDTGKYLIRYKVPSAGGPIEAFITRAEFKQRVQLLSDGDQRVTTIDARYLANRNSAI